MFFKLSQGRYSKIIMARKSNKRKNLKRALEHNEDGIVEKAEEEAKDENSFGIEEV